ncbi:MAG: precorrin-2 C(20)-methyltransferase [Parasporobacterium sp.]|nr:precorrin-2 C(20)-methyltransferase [Parasporobacterium sp.]
MQGIVYGVGVGPGDPELMTLKAVRLIRENDVIAVPGQEAKEAVSYQIAAKAVPEIAEKELLSISMPMVTDQEQLRKEHQKGALLIEQYLEQGKNVVYLTLGDPTVYCSFSYLQHILEADGYQVVLVSGIPSFCAAAARLNLPLAEWDEPLHIVPAVHKTREPLHYEGNYVLMKSARHMKDVKELLRQKDLEVRCVENCGMDTEKIYRTLEEIPDDAGYFSLIIAKEKTQR